MGVPTVPAASGSCPDSVVIVTRRSQSAAKPDKEESTVASAPQHATSSPSKSILRNPLRFAPPSAAGGGTWSSSSSSSWTSAKSSWSSSGPVQSIPGHRRPRPRTTRQSLLFAVVAGAIAFLQLAYHVTYLLHRYHRGASTSASPLFPYSSYSSSSDALLRDPRAQRLLEFKRGGSTGSSRSSSLSSSASGSGSGDASAIVVPASPAAASAAVVVATAAASSGPQQQPQPLSRQLRVDAPGPALASYVDADVSPSPRYAVLLVVPGLGDAQRIDTVARSVSALASTRGSVQLGCLVYVWNPSLIDKARQTLSPLNCDVHESQGMWTHHMSRVPDLSDTNYTHVAVLLDDVDVSDVNLENFMELLEWSGFGAASPAFDDPIYPSMRVRYDCFFHRTDFVNVFFSVFQKPIWHCWQSKLIDLERNPLGWGMDAALHRLCNATLGVVDAYQGLHQGSPGTSSYSQPEARIQMGHYLARALDLPDANGAAKRYLECAGQSRPAAFPACQLYWDGTALSDADSAEPPSCG